MLTLLLPIAALLLGVALLLLGSGLVGTLLPLRGTLEGFNDQILGWMGSGYFAGFFIGTYLAPPLIQRIGHIRAFAFFAALAACAALLHPIDVSPTAWIALRTVSGIALVALYMIIESWLNSHAPDHQRGRIFAVYMVVNLGALAAAQQLLRLDAPKSFVLFSIAAILFCSALLPVTSTRLPQPRLERAHPLPPPTLWRMAPVATAGALMSGLAMGPFWGLGPVYAGRIGLAQDDIALFMSAAILGGALFQWPIGLVSDRIDRRHALAVVALCAALAAGLMMVSGYAGEWVLLAAALYGGLAFAVYPVSVAQLMDHLDAENSLAGGSGLLLIHGLGAAIGPALAGAAMTAAGPVALPGYFLLMQGLLALFALGQVRRRAESVENPAHFMPMVRTSPTVLAMMPTAEDGETPPPGSTAEDNAADPSPTNTPDASGRTAEAARQA